MGLFNVGLIGHGYWGKNLLRNLKESIFVDQIYVADTDPKVITRLSCHIFLQKRVEKWYSGTTPNRFLRAGKKHKFLTWDVYSFHYMLELL